jgi:hypothetical protein
MLKFTGKLLLSALMMSPMAVMADNNYVRLGVGESTFDYSGIPSDHPTGGLLALGTQLDPVWGVEGGLVDFGRVDVISLNNQPAKLSVRALYGAGTANWSVSPQASVYGKLGLAVKYASAAGDSATRVSPLLGIGARYMFTREWGAAVEYSHYGSNGGLALSQATVSALYHF